MHIMPKITKLIMLKHRPFKPQLTGVLETRMQLGSMDRISSIMERQKGALNVLNVELANSLDVNLSNGRIAEIPNNWNENRFSFLMVSELWDGNILVGEEIFQGYTDHSETVGGRLEAGGSVRIDPSMMMYVNRAMKISYSYDNYGARVPQFQKADSMLVDNTTAPGVYNKERLDIWRPMDLSMKYHLNHMVSSDLGDDDHDPRTAWGISVSDANELNRLAKCSKSSNEIGGRMVVDLIKSASRSAMHNRYSFDSGQDTPYEHMVCDLVENNSSNYQTLLYMSRYTTVNQVARWSVSEFSTMFPYVTPDVFSVESYNDLITRHTNSLFNFGNSNDMGDDAFSDTQLTRFQKRIVPYIFDAMQSYGFIKFSGKLTNKTIDGSLYLEHSIALNVSDTVNSNDAIRVHCLKLLYDRLTDNETKAILGGINGEQLVELVFDMDLSISNIFINLNGHILKVKIPSLCDSAFSNLIMPESKSGVMITDLKNMVDGIMSVTEQQQVTKPVVTGW